MMTYHIGKPLFFQHKGNCVQRGGGKVGNNVLLAHIAEVGYLRPHILGYSHFAAAYKNCGLYSVGQQGLDAVLCGLCFQLVAACDKGEQGNVNVHNIFTSLVGNYLSYGLKERRTFNIAHGAAYLGDHHVNGGLVDVGGSVDPFLYLIGYMGDHLYRSAQVISSALLGDNAPVNLAGGNVAVDRKVFVNESFVVTQIQVRFRAVVGDKDLAVLIGAHCAGVYVKIGVELLNGDLIASVFKQASQ